ncbi:MAG: prepilin-type N-terminal cleavage/methylation domain-containing protein [bacterium]|nr:prepilin-type N-terminal cleavage/methylation domain-containing protein [bacterium]
MKQILHCQKGSTLVEVMITTGLFSILMVVLFSVFRYGSEQWRVIEGRSKLQTMMRKVETFMLDDVRRASYDYLAVPNMPDGWKAGDHSKLESAYSSGTPKAGSAFWCLSPLGYDSNGNVYVSRDNEGKLIWNHNVLYYVTELTDGFHRQIYGYGIGQCPPGKCPHKWLIRKEINQDKLLKPKTGGTGGCSGVRAEDFMTAPSSGNYAKQMLSSGERGKGLERVSCLAENVLAFTVSLDYPTVGIVVKTFRVEEASKNAGLSSSQMTEDSVYTVQYSTRLVPNN